jgi:hypothetical protein
VDHATGACSNPAVADGTVCADGDPNTTGDVCAAGVCKGVDHCVGVTCTAQDQCHAAGVCDHATGACSNPAKADGAACDDGSACTVTDTCTAGVCGGAGTPCQNGATCSSSGGAAFCACTAGWTGPTCSAVSDYCASNPCQNGGTCTNGSGGYTCACAGGFRGASCDIPPAPCSLVNGSFEAAGTLYSTVAGGLYSTPGWINLSSYEIQASTMTPAYEGLPAATDGAHVLRLDSWVNGDPTVDSTYYTGVIAQQIAFSMQSGRTYAVKADALGGYGSVPFGATIAFTNEATQAPSKVYAQQIVGGVAAGTTQPDAFDLSYTATAADAGKPLFVWLEAQRLIDVSNTSGGVDNVRLTCPMRPTAAICGCAATWGINAPITLDGSCSSDADPTHKIVAWDWDFSFNGSDFVPAFDPTTGFSVSGPVVTKQDGFATYSEDVNGVPLAGASAHVVALRVTDDTPPDHGGPLTSITTCNVITKPPPHCPHVTAGGPYFAAVGQAITFDASASFDVDHDPVTYQWDFQGAGTFTDASGVTASHAFSAPGTYTIAVRGTDHPLFNPDPTLYSGFAAECPVVAYGTVEVGPLSPVAMTGGPYSTVAGSTVVLDGSGSSDPAGFPLTYAWDLTGDGLYKDSTAANPTFTVGNVAAGTSYFVCLKVSNGSKSAIDCTQVRVVPQRVPPVCSLLRSTVIATCNGGPITVSGDGSRSYSGNLDNSPLGYHWTSDCAATFDAPNAAVTNLTFSAPTCPLACTATLTLTDNSGLVTNCPMTVQLNSATP